MGTKTSAHGNGGPTSIPNGCFCPVRLLSLLSFHSHMESKGLFVHTHCALTRGGPSAHSSYDTRGRTGSGVLQGDQRHTLALLPLWVDRSFPEMRSRLHSRATCRGSKYYGSTRKRGQRLCLPSQLTVLGSWCCPRRGADMAA